MIDQQKPLGSGFGARSTAGEVLDGVDLNGTRAIVTGGHSGLGLETVRALASAGAEITVGARDPDRARSALQVVPGADVSPLDLSDLGSVRVFAGRMVSTGRPIDLLINNAGVMACPETRVGPGWEAQFATNHLGHFALTQRLWPLLRDGARVVSVSSSGHHASRMRWQDIHFERDYDKWLAYGQSKTANALFALHLDHLGRERGVRAFSLHPGKIFTPLQRHLRQDEMIAAGWLDESGAPADPTFKSQEQGAATTVWAATSPRLSDLGGLYCEDCDVAPVAEEAGLPGVRPYAIDPGEAERLWLLSSRLTTIEM